LGLIKPGGTTMEQITLLDARVGHDHIYTVYIQ